MEKDDSRTTEEMKIYPGPDTDVNVMAIAGNTGAIVHTTDNSFRYIRLNSALNKKLRELIETETNSNFPDSILSQLRKDGKRIGEGNSGVGMVHLSEALKGKVNELFECMIDESNRYAEMSDNLRKLWILEALIHIANRCEHDVAKKPYRKNNSLISKFRKLVEENFIKLSLPKDYAALLFVTPNYLNQVSHKVLGKTAGEVIRDRKLLEAKRMLTDLDLNISQIANNLNFTDPSHFSKFFKKYTGRSPEDFRRKAFEDIG